MLGLLAMLLLTDARRAARETAAGRLVLLEDQDRGLWDRAKISEGTRILDRAVRLGRPGPYQLQAAIAACHAAAADALFTHRVRVTSAGDIDAELTGWLRDAYASAR